MKKEICELRLKAYCGYLRTKTPLQAAKIQAQLDKTYRWKINQDGFGDKTVILPIADYIVMMIYGERQKAEIWEYYNSKCKPQKGYRLISDTEKTFLEMNKTQYDFAVYIGKNFSTFELALEADNAEFSRLETERISAEKKALEEEERAKAQKAAEAEFNQKLLNDAAALVGTKVHDLTKSVLNSYSWYNGTVSTDIRFMRLYVMAQNIENPFAKSELCGLLHNDNKASIRLFSTFSGVKMPSSHKERCDIINGLKQSDIRRDEVNILEVTQSA